jgi:hypothetical protein
LLMRNLNCYERLTFLLSNIMNYAALPKAVLSSTNTAICFDQPRAEM